MNCSTGTVAHAVRAACSYCPLVCTRGCFLSSTDPRPSSLHTPTHTHRPHTTARVLLVGAQDLVVDELARMADALGRELNLEALRALRRVGQAAMGPIPIPTAAGLASGMTAAQGLHPLLLPVQLPYLMLDGVVGRVEAALELSADDRQSLRSLRRIISILAQAGRK
jgi:hypothetical protein